jgi:hypothetical protein
MRLMATVILAAWSLTAARAQTPAPKSASPVLPDEARESLKKKWPGWQLAAPAASIGACLPGGKAPATFVTADFDTDGHADYAAAVQTQQGVRLAALTWRPWGFDLYDVDALGDQGAAASIVVAARGVKFTNPRTLQEDYFPGDTLTSRSCDKGATAYFWTGVGFSRLVIPSFAGPPSSEQH